MNNNRRKLLRKARSHLDSALSLTQLALDEEQDCYNNLPESIQDSPRGDAMDSCIDLLGDAADEIQSAASMLETAAG